MRFWKVLVMMKAQVQLVSTHTELPSPRALVGKISDITSHGVGPQPRAKPEKHIHILLANREVFGQHYNMGTALGLLLQL